MRERLKADPSEEVKKYLNIPGIYSTAERSFDNMARINLTHALMLCKQGIIEKEDAKTLVRNLYEIMNNGVDGIKLDPNIEDLYFNIEQHLIGKIGIECAGKLHTGRSRNDLHSTYARMDARDEMFNFFPRFFRLRDEIIRIADENKETVITGYTHTQAAQPITVGFYFSAIEEALERDFDRILAAYHRLNQSPLGSCAFAGTGFPINREYTSELLGFEAPIVNALDCVASKDYLLEIAADFSIMASTINRFAQDLYLWATNEFAYIELDDSSCSVSSIMPQKKNPTTLEHCKAKSAHFLSTFVDIFVCLKGISYGHSRDCAHESTHLFYDMYNEMEAVLELLTSTLRKVKIKKDCLKVWADTNFCTATELADEIVRKEKVSFRQAHQIVGSVVGEAVNLGVDAKGITAEMLDKAAVEFAGRTFNWTHEQLAQALDSKYSVEAKLSLGAAAPIEVAKMLDSMKKKLVQDRESVAKLEIFQKTAIEKLEKAVAEYLG